MYSHDGYRHDRSVTWGGTVTVLPWPCGLSTVLWYNNILKVAHPFTEAVRSTLKAPGTLGNPRCILETGPDAAAMLVQKSVDTRWQSGCG